MAQDVMWYSYSGLSALEGKKPCKPEFQSTFQSFEQKEQSRLKSQGKQRVEAKAN